VSGQQALVTIASAGFGTLAGRGTLAVLLALRSGVGCEKAGLVTRPFSIPHTQVKRPGGGREAPGNFDWFNVGTVVRLAEA